MTTIGIDVGSKTIKVVIFDEGKILAKSITTGGLEDKKIAEDAINDALIEANLSRNDISKIVATGAGRKTIDFADDELTEVGADAKGVISIFPSARTIIDVGAEEGRGIKCDSNGKVIDFAVNEKCAAGAGSFAESMARALELSLEDFGVLSTKSNKSIPMNAQCVVFAESEVVSLIHANTPKEDISKAVHDAIADRIISMVRRVGIEKDVVLIGGVAKNVGFVDAIKRSLEMDILIPDNPEYIGALGAAIAATE
jgi:benzoyl-CoA reductase subunit D